MIFLMGHWVLIAILALLCFAGSAATAILEAYIDTRKRPKEEMLWCNRHGYFRKQHALALFPQLENPQLMCPQCYKAAVWDNVQIDRVNHHG